MKLSTFLLLVSKNMLFLPTVTKLQRLDFVVMWPLVEPHKGWLLSNILRPDRPQAWKNPSEERKRDQIRVVNRTVCSVSPRDS